MVISTFDKLSFGAERAHLKHEVEGVRVLNLDCNHSAAELELCLVHLHIRLHFEPCFARDLNVCCLAFPREDSRWIVVKSRMASSFMYFLLFVCLA